MRIFNSILRVLVASLLLGMPAFGEDIDLFAGLPVEVDDALPSVIFILDNTSNWSRQSQQWPGGKAQGESEVAAIRTSLAGLTGRVNVGLFEFVTDGNANQNGGYVRFDLQPLTADAQSELNDVLLEIERNINSPVEKRNSNESWGGLMEDLYNYLAGARQSDNGGGTPARLADSDAYTTNYSVFESPLTAGDICTNTYVIFIGNPNSSGPSADEASNTQALVDHYADLNLTPPDALSGSNTGLPLPLLELSTTIIPGEEVILGNSASRWKNNQQDQCTQDESGAGGLCDGVGNCSCTTKTDDCSRGSCNWTVASRGEDTSTTAPTGDVDTAGGRGLNLDDWAKFLQNYGVPMTVTVDDAPVTQRIPVVTYTIDVFNAQQNADTSALLFSTATVGGGQYFEARSENQLINVIEGVLSDIVSVSSSFSAVTLPIEAGQRTQSKNEVYIGTFRPAQEKKPRWFGNLKRYRLGLFNNQVELADINFRMVINTLTGAPGQCSVSWWTEDSGDYWAYAGVSPAPRSECFDSGILTSDWSDLPDGSFVEKGGAAQHVRNGDSRTLYTMPAAAGDLIGLSDGDAAAFGGSDILDYLRGDVAGVDETMPDVGRRPAVHGGVIHSRPAVINYGTSSKIFYGANDGLFHAVDSVTGVEDWAVIAPDHYGRIARLYNNSPLILYEGLPADAYNDDDPDPESKDYFFDGGTAQWVTYTDDDVVSKALLFPTMRRGGRQLYGLDVTAPGSPEMLWAAGCDSNGTCSSADFADIGQTWSTPSVVTVDGYLNEDGESVPVLIFGGGYDECLDTDDDVYGCGNSPDGAALYILDAVTGTLLKKFGAGDGIGGPLVAEVTPIDTDFDGHADLVYAVGAEGGLYRVSLNKPDDVEAVVPGEHWSITRVAQVSGDTRRLLNSPVPFVVPGTRIVGVTFGSGDRERPLRTNYPYADSVQNRMYVFFDRPDGFADGVSLPVDLDSLINAATYNSAGTSLVDSNGWYFSLPDRGEQIVNPAAVGGGRLFFNSYQPGGPSTGLCSPPIGIATAYSIPVFAPEAVEGEELTAGGMPIPPVIVTVSIEPQGYDPECQGEECVQPELRTVCIGCKNFDVVDLEPTVIPERDRVWWIEEIDQ